MPNGRKKPHLIPPIIQSSKELKHLEAVKSLVEEKLAKPEDDGTPYIALKYYYHRFQCFSKWSPEDLKGFSRLCDKMRSMDWEMIKNSKGFGYKVLDNYPEIPPSIQSKLSKDTSYFELRASQKRRVIGFKAPNHSAFYLIILDKNHDTV